MSSPGIVSIFNVELVAEGGPGAMHLGTRQYDPDHPDYPTPHRHSGEEGYQVMMVCDWEAEWYARRILWLLRKGPDPGLPADFDPYWIAREGGES